MHVSGCFKSKTLRYAKEIMIFVVKIDNFPLTIVSFYLRGHFSDAVRAVSNVEIKFGSYMKVDI